MTSIKTIASDFADIAQIATVGAFVGFMIGVTLAPGQCRIDPHGYFPQNSQDPQCVETIRVTCALTSALCSAALGIIGTAARRAMKINRAAQRY